MSLHCSKVSCPGVHLPDKDDICLSMCFMGQSHQSESLPAVFPLLLHEKMTFEKIFRNAVDPGDIAVMLEYETVMIELVQLIPPVAETLACFEEDARHFLFPEPKLVPSSSGVDREVLMTRAHHFPGIAPRLEFSTKTTIIECPADAQMTIYPNVPMRPLMKRNRKPSSRPRSCSPQRRQPPALGRRQGFRVCRDRSTSFIPRTQSLSPHTQRLARISLDLDDKDPSRASQHTLSSWPGASGSAPRSGVFTSSSSPLTRSSSIVRYSPTLRRRSLSNGLVGGISQDDPPDSYQGPDPSGVWRSYREPARHSRTRSSSHREWEEVQERVRGLLTTSKAVSRLALGATHCEVDHVLARRSISPGPPL
ncbi:spermatogenesis associated 6-like protein [Eleginops maclovinus]|uniref:spermatogenesis associated 6-like protein n=1 Tax=Eleginops maclovinus TaxID=56733 RepID=UPI00308024CC